MTGRYDQSLDQDWLLNLKVSEKLVGGIPDSKTGNIRRVDIKDILLGDLCSHWEYERHVLIVNGNG